MPLAELLERLLRGVPATTIDGPRAWWAAHQAATASLAPFDRAVLGGARADRLGWAFAAGYEAALAVLVPDRDPTRSAALCATEPTGVHPARIATSIDAEGCLSGDKTFVTLGDEVDDLLVLARRGTRDDGTADLVLVELAKQGAGVSLTPLGTTPFVPEIPHASVHFDRARAGRVLPGDGWTGYVRPFRTVEDLFVHAAFLGFLVSRGVAWGFPRVALERTASSLASLHALVAEPPASPGVHVALAGVIGSTREIIAMLDREAAWASAPADDRARFERDRPLLDVAGRARTERLGRAWQKLGEPG